MKIPSTLHVIELNSPLLVWRLWKTASRGPLWPLAPLFSAAQRSWTAHRGTGNAKKKRTGDKIRRLGPQPPTTHRAQANSTEYWALCALAWIYVGKYNGNLRKCGCLYICRVLAKPFAVPIVKLIKLSISWRKDLIEVGPLPFESYIWILFEKIWPPHIYLELWESASLFLCLFITPPPSSTVRSFKI